MDLPGDEQGQTKKVGKGDAVGDVQSGVDLLDLGAEKGRAKVEFEA